MSYHRLLIEIETFSSDGFLSRHYLYDLLNFLIRNFDQTCECSEPKKLTVSIVHENNI